MHCVTVRVIGIKKIQKYSLEVKLQKQFSKMNTIKPFLLHIVLVHNMQEERFMGRANFKYLIWKVD